MSWNIRTRLEKLEAGLGTADIVVWCDTPEQMEEAMHAMISEGKIRPDQRALCVHCAAYQLREQHLCDHFWR